MNKSVLEFYCDKCDIKYIGVMNDFCEERFRYRSQCSLCNSSNYFKGLAGTISASNYGKSVVVYKESL